MLAVIKNWGQMKTSDPNHPDEFEIGRLTIVMNQADLPGEIRGFA